MPNDTTRQADLLALAKRRLYGNYKPAPFVLVRGKGCDVEDAAGKKYLDLCAGVAVDSVGHAHPTYVKAICDQAAQIVHASNYFYNAPNILLADELCRRTEMDRAFFCNSGAEANEALLKLARRHFYAKGETARTRVIAFHNGFHGRTLGALSMTGTSKYREGFGELGNVTHVDYGDIDAVKKEMQPDVCAVIVEAIQGEGGVLPAPAGFLKALREACNATGALLLLDEIQTGVGRLGRFLGSTGAGARPDAISLAKGLAGGVPIGVMLTTEKLADALPPGTHGSTFGGNPLACAAALAVLKIIDDEKLIDGARAKGEALAGMLRRLVTDFPKVCETARGEGLLQGLVMQPGFVARDVLPKVQDAGVLLTAAGDRVLRFTPPLVVKVEELERGTNALRGVLATLHI